jgi:phenylpropionate dioxygenase-like ring-hydroxylating dioxygenase large terminal subunit
MNTQSSAGEQEKPELVRRQAAWLPAYWYILCESKELGRRPLKRLLYGTPLVLFRDEEGQVGTLVDRCPHRNVPLSLGRVTGGRLQCAYHGWEFDSDGVCRRVPGLCGAQVDRARDALSHATREQEGYIWVWGEPGVEPTSEPPEVGVSQEAGYANIRQTVVFDATLHATIENALDVPHTAFLHRGLFRGRRDPIQIKAVVTRTPSSVQVEFLGEPRPPGLLARILSPSGGLVTHFDRFLMPSIAQVEYRIGDENHLRITGYCTPLDATRTRVFSSVDFRLRIPHWLIRPFVVPIAMRVFQQDAWVLKAQNETVERFGGEHFASTPIDLIGGQVWRLMRRAEQGRLPEPEPDWQREVPLEV